MEITGAYEEFLTKLFGRVPEDVSKEQVTRSRYTEVMKQVQEKHGLKQGHPLYMTWIFTLVGNSPIIVDDND